MSEKIIEIRPCVGGKEAEMLCQEMLIVYLKYCNSNNITVEIINNSSKTITLIVNGNSNTLNVFENEKGIHKFQRVSKTEKNGRIHTSTISIAVLNIKENINYESLYNPKDIKIQKLHCGGPGGQNVNKVETGIRITHIPSGIIVKSTQERSQYQNKINAFKILNAKLQEQQNLNSISKTNNIRSSQVKNSERADSRRTYNEQRGEIVDKISNKKCKYKEFFKGNINLLFNK